MKQKSSLDFVKMIMVVTIFICLGALIGAIGYLSTKLKIEPAAPPSTEESEIDTSDQKTYWRTYRNEEYGYEIEYPESCSIKEIETESAFCPGDTQGIERLEYIEIENCNIFIDVYSNPKNLTIQEWNDIYQTLTCTGSGLSFETQILINGLSATKGLFGCCSMMQKTVAISKDSKVYLIHSRKTLELSNDSPDKREMELWLEGEIGDSDDIFNQILSTFKFIDIDETANWKTCENIQDLVKQVECYTNLAKETVNEIYCEKIADEYLEFKWDCYVNLAILKNDPSLCEKAGRGSLYESCIEYFEREDETAGWQTYRDEKYGFEIKYPKNWNYQEEIPQPQNFGVRVNFSDFQGKHILTIQNPIPEIGYEPWTIIETKQIKIQNSGKYLTKKILKPKEQFKDENFNNLVLVYWNLDDWNKSGQISLPFLEDSDPNIKVFNQMLSTFKFIETNETTNYKTYKGKQFYTDEPAFTFKYSPGIWDLKDDYFSHKEISDCKISYGLWRNTLYKVIEYGDITLGDYKASQSKLAIGSEVSIINIHFKVSPSTEFRISLPKNEKDKQTCEQEAKEMLSMIDFEN